MQVIKLKTDYQRLCEIAGTRYAQIYSQIKKVNVISSNLETREGRYIGYGEYELIWVLAIKHSTGSFSFPIENASKAGVSNYDEEIQNIFFNVLHMATTSKQIA